MCYYITGRQHVMLGKLSEFRESGNRKSHMGYLYLWYFSKWFFFHTDQLIDCRKFIERGCLGYLIAALSCHDNTMRGAAYHVLDNFFLQLEASRFPEKEQQLYVIELIRNSLDKPNVKLPCIITVFLAKVVRLMLKAGM